MQSMQLKIYQIQNKTHEWISVAELLRQNLHANLNGNLCVSDAVKPFEKNSNSPCLSVSDGLIFLFFHLITLQG